MLSTLIWTVAFLGLAGFFVFQSAQRFAILGYMRPADRWENIPERINRTLKYAIGQFKFFRRPPGDSRAPCANTGSPPAPACSAPPMRSEFT